MDVRTEVPLAPLTTFGIGGPAAFFVRTRSTDELAEAFAAAQAEDVPVIVLGGGSNILVPDEGVNALVLQVAHKGIDFGHELLRVAAGEVLLNLVQYAAVQGLGGLTNLAGIPGTVGGAVRGNAGAFGSEIQDVIAFVTVFDTTTGYQKIYSKPECMFAYRSSVFKQEPHLVITEVALALPAGAPAELEVAVAHTISEREKRHIQDIKSAGSFFKNPVVEEDIQHLFEKDKGVKSKEGRVPAGWLMDQSGLRGARVGDAVASPYHTNYFINMGNATAQEVKQLAAFAKEKVKKEFGIELEEEAVVL